MRIKAIVLIIAGVLGGIFVCLYDTMMGKPVNDITGPKSILALIICAALIIAGITFFARSLKKKK